MVLLKEEKQAFVTGHGGTTPWELVLVCASAPIGLFLYQQLLPALPIRGAALHRPAVEAIVVLLPMILCQTEFLYPFGVIYLGIELVLAMLILFFVQRRNRRRGHKSNHTKSSQTTSSATATSSKNKNITSFPWLSAYRSAVSYLTFVAILAVDFHLFPRRFAKTETTGYGLMDLGAGSFVVSGGLVSRYARHRTQNQNQNQDAGRRTKGAWPLLVLGGVRLATNKGLEYQEHVSEYGVHWNFFFTLAIVWTAAQLLRRHFVPFGFLCVGATLALYQMTLSFYGWQDYIEVAPRTCGEEHFSLGNDFICNMVAANREGILGCIGYLCLHLLSEEIAHYCLWNHTTATKPAETSMVSMRTRVGTAALASWAIHLSLVHVLGIVTSRRSTNASFVTWTLAHNLTILFLFQCAFENTDNDNNNNDDKSCKNHSITRMPPIFEAVNRHGLW
eukprot:CAMPEP_0198293468 /NCGR_PEP_ID=MMETSP1449-20131203/17336_1 /TAXON_ID=420275 /ORGANISM="Attheya septentrionalis, Strain CCMP2084" /LENGTH=446 /DNA_ID=CAMNT_0043993059 /DNA_START=74 /DNA_END=1411 /DNA_ORIENTATION=-